MKKVLLLLTLSLTLISSAFSQKSRFEPYLGVGTSVSSSVFSQGAEIGMYNDRVWFAATVSTVEVNEDRSWAGGVKAYYKLGKRSQLVETFATTGVSVALDNTAAITLEPGAAVVINAWNRVAPQFSVGFPIYENTRSPLKPLTVNFGFGLNFWLY